MIANVLLWIYFLGCIGAIIPTARVVLDDLVDDTDDPEPMDYLAAVAMGICVCWVWPLFVPGYVAYRVLAAERRVRK